MKYFLLLAIALITGLNLKANQNTFSEKQYQVIIEVLENDDIQIVLSTDSNQVVSDVKFKRGKAILFTVLTGLLGGHRIYLGTHHRTPIIYSITLGGLGILPLVDLIHIIFTKDLSVYEHKSQVIMWR